MPEFPERDDEQPDRTILVLLDGSELAERILPYAAYHAGLSDGELILLSVCVPPEIVEGDLVSQKVYLPSHFNSYCDIDFK